MNLNQNVRQAVLYSGTGDQRPGSRYSAAGRRRHRAKKQTGRGFNCRRNPALLDRVAGSWLKIKFLPQRSDLVSKTTAPESAWTESRH